MSTRHRPTTIQRPARCVVCTHLWPCPVEAARESSGEAADILRGVRESGAAVDQAVLDAWNRTATPTQGGEQ